MKQIVKKVENLKKEYVKNIIDERINEFKNIDKNSNDELFSEMCFCLLTANYNAEKSIKIQKQINECFIKDSKEELIKKLKDMGHRFPNARADYIFESRNCRC